MNLKPLLVALCFVAPMHSQTATATLGGRIYDPSGAVINDAVVELKNADTGASRPTVSATDGGFRVSLLPPGRYSVMVRKAGFSPTVLSPVVLQVGDDLLLRVRMQIGDGRDIVNVTDSTPLLREGISVGTVIGRQFLENQPLNGRSFQALVELAPGVNLTRTDVTTSGQFSVNGQRPNTNYFTVDGVSANFGINGSATLYESAGGMLPAYSALGGTNNLASVDAVQEFRVETSTYAPEYGRQPGAQVSIVTRSGTNQFHGAAFNYLRNDKFDANDWFANRNRVARPALRQNDFGFVFGGPLLVPKIYSGKDRTFFFISYEGLRLRQPAVTAPILVPTAAARASAAGLAATILNAFPLPTGPVSTTDPNLGTFVGSFSNPSSLNATSFRLDHRFGNRLNIFGRYNHAPSQVDQRAVFGTPNTITQTKALTETLTLGATAIVTPHLINELRFNHSQAEQGAASRLDSFGGATSVSNAALLPAFAGSDASGSFTIGAQPSYLEFGLNAANVQRQINVANTLSWTRHSHAFRFGFDWRRLSPEYFGSPYRQLVNFSNVAQVLAGNFGSAFLISANVLRLYPRYQNFSAFMQDTWRIHPRLTLTYGLRWDVNPAPTEKNGEQPYTVSGLDNLASLTLARKDRLYDTRFNNVAPRLGIAYRPFGNGSTVVRGGVGIFYDLGYAFTGSAYSSTVFPFGQLRSVGSSPLSLLNSPPPPFAVTPPYGRLFAYGSDFNVPYSTQFNFTIEQGLGAHDRLSVAYVGAIGRRLGRVTSLRSPSTLPSNFSRVDLVESDGTSDYNSFQAQYEHRLSGGLQALVSYTLAKSLDLVSDESIVNLQAPTVKVDPSLDRGPSAFDVRHTFSAGVSYNIPGVGGRDLRTITGGWGLDAIIRARSATPVNIVTGTDVLGLGLTSVSRPNVISTAPLYVDDPNVAGGWRINRDVFRVPASGTQGNLGRNSLRGFGASQLDLSLRRQFGLGERASLQFRGDVFNLFNNPNFASPTAALNNPNFGISTQMLGRSLGSAGISGGYSPLYQVGGPRSLQLSLRLQF